MKKADAIKAVIQNIKDENRSSFGPEDIERLKKVYSGGLTQNIISDFRAEALKAGIEDVDKLDFEEYLPSRRRYGQRPGKFVAEPEPTSVGPTSKGLGATRGITLTDEGLTFLLAEIEQSPESINTSYLDEPFTGRKHETDHWKAKVKLDKERGTIKTSFNNVLRSVFDKIRNYGDPYEFFPEVSFLDVFDDKKRLSPQVVDAYLGELWKRGWLEDADPDFEALDTEFKGLEKNYQNRASTRGRQLLDTKKRKGIPVVIGAASDGTMVYSPDEVRPYSLRLSDKGKKHLDSIRAGRNKILIGKSGERVTKIVSEIPSLEPIPDPTLSATQTLDDQLRESRKQYRQNQAIQNRIGGPPIANEVTSPRTGKRYANYNAMVSAEGPVRPPGGETVEPNRGEASRKAKGAVIARRDVNTFKQAMANAVSINPQLPTHPLLDEGGKPNLFKGIMREARKIDPTVSMNAMQDIKDYLFFTGYLEADAAVSEKLGPSRLSDADVPEYVKPTQKYYKDGLNILDAGGENEPLVIRKLSADPDMDDVRRGAKPMPQITGPETATPDKTVSERTSRFLRFIEGGKKGLGIILPFGTGAAVSAIPTRGDTTPLGDRILEGIIGSTRLADATPAAKRAREEAARVRERAGPDYKRMRSADEETFSRIAEEEASGRLKGPRGFLYLD
jgi:hypothetical protein